MAKTSIKAAVRDAVREDSRARTRKDLHAGTSLGAATADSFVNFAHKLGVGADNPLSSSTYGYNPITRNRTLLEWIHRGSWLGGVAVDLVADDMTRAGVDFTCEMSPDDAESLDRSVTSLGIWNSINEVVRWSRLYGGCIGVMLIDGQDMKTPLRPETVGKGQFKGVLPLDRWMVEPSLGDLVTEFGSSLGLPKFYTVQSNAPALRGQTIHYSRLAMRLEGIQLPYQQRLTENMWGISVLERLYDRMVAFDSASTGAAQLVYKAHLRTLTIDGLRDIVAAGGAPMDGLMRYTEVMRRFQGIEGITLLDGKDTFEVQEHSAFSGLSDALNQFGQQLSGALQIPLVRLFGQSPGGFNSTGDSDIRTYYDGINQQQNKGMHGGVTTIYRLAAQSEGIKIPKNFGITFASLWQMTEEEKGKVAKEDGETVGKAYGDGIIGRQTALKELRQSSRTTGRFTNITEEMIEAADDDVEPPMPEGFDTDPLTGLPVMTPAAQKSAAALNGEDPDKKPGEKDGVRPQGEEKPVGTGKKRRRILPE